jgi:hypothetical protein
MCQGVAAEGGAAVGQADVRLPDDNLCEVQVVGLAGGPAHHPAPNAVQPRVATVSHFEQVSPSPGTEEHKCARERIKAGRSGQQSCSSWMLSRAYGWRERCGEMYRNRGRYTVGRAEGRRLQQAYKGEACLCQPERV